jgi:hypothetical protein
MQQAGCPEFDPEHKRKNIQFHPDSFDSSFFVDCSLKSVLHNCNARTLSFGTHLQSSLILK